MLKYIENKEYYENLDKRKKEYKEYKDWLDNYKPDEEPQPVIESEEEVEPQPNLSEEASNEEFINKSAISTEDYNKLLEMKERGKLLTDEYDWFFRTYNNFASVRTEKCMCVGKIKKMLAKMIVTYKRDNNLK